jgi:hypothetical protein
VGASSLRNGATAVSFAKSKLRSSYMLSMLSTRALQLSVFITIFSVTYHYSLLPTPFKFEMSAAEWTFEAQYGYFSHDSDPETWKFRATTRPGLGLVERSFVTDSDVLTAEGQPRTNVTQWQRFMRHVQHLNDEDPNNKQYKMFYVVRHGQGFHNVKEEEVGRDEWNVSGLFDEHVIPGADQVSAPLG